MATPTISVKVVADAKRASAELGKVSGSLSDVGREADKASSKVAGIADASDTVASASSQAAGGIGDLGGALALMPGPLGALGTGMEAAAPAIMGVTGAADLLNLATAKFPALSKVTTAASKIMAGGMRVLGAAIRFAMGPWGILIAVVITAIVLLWKKNEAFRSAVIKVWNAIKAGVGKVLGWFTGTLLPWFKALPGKVLGFIKTLPAKYIGIWRTALTGAWNLAKSIGGKIVAGIKAIPGLLSKAGSSFLRAGKTLIGKLWDGLKSVGKLGVDMGRNLFNGVVDGINKAIDAVNGFLPNSVKLPGLPDIDLPDNPIPNIPRLAQGGIVTGTQLAVVGDNARKREAIIPIEKWPELMREMGLGGGGPVDLSDSTIDRLAGAILAGAARVSRGVVASEARSLVTGVVG